MTKTTQVERTTIEKELINALNMLSLETKHYLNTGVGKEYLIERIKTADSLLNFVKTN